MAGLLYSSSLSSTMNVKHRGAVASHIFSAKLPVNRCPTNHFVTTRRQTPRTVPSAQTSDELTAVPRESRKDPFIAAGLRLERLVANTGDGEQEFVEQLVDQEGTEFKTMVAMLYGSLLLLGSIVLTTVCHGDPWGGMSLSWHSFNAGLIGFLVGLPLAGMQLWSWSPQAENAFPVLRDLHACKTEQAKQWLSDLTLPQVVTVMLAESIPPLFLLFPTAQAAAAVFLELYSSMLGSGDLFLAIPTDVIAGLSLALMSGASAVVARSELAIAEEEYEVIQTAVYNSDRFYRQTATDSAETASAAFKAVAAAWVSSRTAACNAAAAQSMGTVLILGIVWHVTGDLAAPLFAGAMVNGVDYGLMQRRATQRCRTAGSNKRF